MPKPTEIRPTTFSDFIAQVESIKSAAAGPLWFRGSGKASYKLTPSLYRHGTKKTIEEIAKLERHTMIWFRQRSIPFTSKSLSDDWDALFYMQHYRAPTRLLDWSESPFVALYFSLMSAAFTHTKTGLSFKDDAAVWVLEPISWNRHALNHQSYDGEILVTKDTELKGYQPAESFAKMNNHAVAMFGAHNSPRIVAQRGVFTIFGQNVASMDDAFDTAGFPATCLIKILIDKTLIYNMRQSLLSYGITESAIYPDLEGLSLEMRRSFGFEG
ncbi:MAG: FRG domain-containing protein [Telluria sp.]